MGWSPVYETTSVATSVPDNPQEEASALHPTVKQKRRVHGEEAKPKGTTIEVFLCGGVIKRFPHLTSIIVMLLITRSTKKNQNYKCDMLRWSGNLVFLH